jgi:hypothetical protein
VRFGTWNVRSLYRVGSFRAAARELAKDGYSGSGMWGYGTGECGNELSGSIKCGEFLD